MLLVEALSDVDIELGRRSWTLVRGYYVYIGSSSFNRPYLRILRHFRLVKKRHWHVDYLTTSPLIRPVIGILLYGIPEDDIYLALSGSRLFKAVVPGFGSADARNHLTHLFRLEAESGINPVRKLLEVAQGLTTDLVELVIYS